ncbi:hypothetical protein JE971_004130 [Salmonella enterica subsp. enterica serovar Agona]|nr:hypothetical protein [Salmonella enterica subsp. enterica serovar Agona]ECM4294488.1 hypothetical protein [Salmonella enterica subsp. enterica serovar Montevideo]EED3651533.1 hypothetical protein [Salmonella enterica subsp. enterica serovar Agona]EHA0437371.1 hypothetical protein [Salmonella enterica subsp. enterica serovar Agona]
MRGKLAFTRIRGWPTEQREGGRSSCPAMPGTKVWFGRIHVGAEGVSADRRDDGRRRAAVRKTTTRMKISEYRPPLSG